MDQPIIPEQPHSITKKGILRRTALIIWLVTLITISGFITAIIPYHIGALLNNMVSMARVMASSIGQVTSSSIISEDYSSVVDHCIKVLSENPSIYYIVVTKENGFSIITTGNKWYYEDFGKEWISNHSPDNSGIIKYSNLVNHEVFQYSYPVIYSGIEWGWINIGLSLDKYNQDVHNMYLRIILLGVGGIFLGLIVSIIFSNRLNPAFRTHRHAVSYNQCNLS